MLCSHPAIALARPDASGPPYLVTRIWTTLGETRCTIFSTASLKASRAPTEFFAGGACARACPDPIVNRIPSAIQRNPDVSARMGIVSLHEVRLFPGAEYGLGELYMLY